MSDTNTQPESREDAIQNHWSQRADDLEWAAYVENSDGRLWDRGFKAGYDAGLAARSPRDEVPSELVKRCEALWDFLDAEGQPDFRDAVRTLLDRSSRRSPRDEEAVEKAKSEAWAAVTAIYPDSLYSSHVWVAFQATWEAAINASKSPHPAEDEKKNEQARDWGSSDDIEASI